MTQTQPVTVRRRDNSSTEACGYITFLLSTAFFAIYFLWALLPNHIVQHIDEHYTTYYLPRELAGYIPTYLSLLFIFAPILYMGLNMLSSPTVDGIDGLWDTRSNTCTYNNMGSESGNGTKNSRVGSGGRSSSNGGFGISECNINNNDNNSFNDGGTSHQYFESLPSICDEDVRAVNLRIRQRLSKQNQNMNQDGTSEGEDE